MHLILMLWAASFAATPNVSKPGKTTAFVFLSAKCPCSSGHEEKLKELAQTYSPEIQFTGIHSNADESSELAREHFKESNLGFPVIEDPQAKIADELGALKTPHVFLISAEGKILFQGGVDDSKNAAESKTQYLKDALEDVKAGREPKVATARSLGCVIKRPSN